MVKFFLFILGVIFSSIGLAFIILYLNLMTIGYSFWQFGEFIIRRTECLLFIVGIILIIFSFERWIKDELLLRRFDKSSR